MHGKGVQAQPLPGELAVRLSGAKEVHGEEARQELAVVGAVQTPVALWLRAASVEELVEGVLVPHLGVRVQDPAPLLWSERMQQRGLNWAHAEGHQANKPFKILPPPLPPARAQPHLCKFLGGGTWPEEDDADVGNVVETALALKVLGRVLSAPPVAGDQHLRLGVLRGETREAI